MTPDEWARKLDKEAHDIEENMHGDMLEGWDDVAAIRIVRAIMAQAWDEGYAKGDKLAKNPYLEKP